MNKADGVIHWRVASKTFLSATEPRVGLFVTAVARMTPFVNAEAKCACLGRLMIANNPGLV
jgi:hypothetical protein